MSTKNQTQIVFITQFCSNFLPTFHIQIYLAFSMSYKLLTDQNVMGIQKGNYTDSIDNKKYAIEGLRLYKINFQLSKTNLWIDTLSSLNEVYKRPNGQMSLVVDLYNKGYIK